jgi:LuxR family quorum-sensing system transcriptional regulator SolR
MVKSWEEIQSTLMGCADDHTTFAATVGFARELGFEYCCYALRMPVPIHKPDWAIFNTYPNGWMDHYLTNNFIRSDPTVARGESSLLPIVWSDELFGSSPKLWTEARDFGLNFGLAKSCWLGGGVFGLLSLARSTSAIDFQEVRAIAESLNTLATLTHERMAELLGSQMAPQRLTLLTQREKEVLMWTSEGKTSAEIGQMLDISERTVNFHINNVLRKFDSPNKIQATARAVALGLL